ncbi:MAG: hypothetical protein AB7S26_16340 [Sandaracinaceae bacterium]
MLRRIVRASLAVALFGCAPDFSIFTVVDPDGGGGGDASARDAGADAGAERDAGADGGPPGDGGRGGGGDADVAFVPTAIDTPCTREWSDPGISAACPGREIADVAAPFDSLALALGRASDGTITVAFNELDGPDTGAVRTVSFAEASPDTVTEGPRIDPVASIGDVVGTHLAIATEAPDMHHIAYWLRSDFGSEVGLRTLRGTTMGLPTTVATAVGPVGVVDVAVDTDGRIAIAWHDDAAGATAARREEASGAFGTRATLRNDGDSRLEGPGAIGLVAAADGSVHAAYQWSVTLAASAPSYSIGAAFWSTARTLDNIGIANRASGVGADITMVGEDAVVAYLDWQSGSGEIRLARVRSGVVDPVVTTHMMGLAIADLPGRHPIVLGTDARGWMHLLVADASSTETTLEYHRETMVAGELRWIVDTVARLPGVTPEEVHVDMKIGPDRRPHIVFWDPGVGVIRYATARP